MSSEEEYGENPLYSEEIPSALQEMYGDDDEDMDSEELRDMQKKHQIQSDDSILDEQEEDDNEQQLDSSQENQENGENQSENESNESDIDNQNNEQFEQQQQFNEKIRKLQTSKGDEFNQNIHSILINTPQNKENIIEKQKLLKKLNPDSVKQIPEQEKQQLKNDTEDFQSQLEKLQKSVLENNFPIFNQHKLLQNKKSGLDLQEGLGFLNSKSLLFQEYMINLNIYLLRKIQGEEIETEFVKNLLYQKTLLQKMKPVEKKLDYQIQKMLKLAEKKNTIKNTKKAQQLNDSEEEDEDLDEEDPYNFKANPSELTNNQEQDNENANKTGKYVAPKLVSALSKEEKLEQQRLRQEEKRKNILRRQLANNFVADKGFTEEIKVSQHGRQNIDKRQQERQRYEEEHFVRLPVTKKDKAMERKVQRRIEIGGEKLDDFSEQRQIRELLTSEKIIEKSSKKSYVEKNSNSKQKTTSFTSNNLNVKRKNNSKSKSKGKGGKKKMKR